MEEEEQQVVGELVDPEDVPLGETVWIARQLEVGFDGRLGSAQTIPLASGIDTSEAVSAVVLFTLHGQNSWPAGTTLTVRALAVELDPVEPEATFLGVELASLVATKGDAPALWVTGLSVVPSKTLVELEWSQVVEEGSGAQTATISAALVLRRHVRPTYRVR
ncbi:MAG: hypothetical protein JNL21_39215 [Myxococcales bacterium]|nr:hypothetical protein [Myxococcales bacterium]